MHPFFQLIHQADVSQITQELVTGNSNGVMNPNLKFGNLYWTAPVHRSLNQVKKQASAVIWSRVNEDVYLKSEKWSCCFVGRAPPFAL